MANMSGRAIRRISPFDRRPSHKWPTPGIAQEATHNKTSELDCVCSTGAGTTGYFSVSPSSFPDSTVHTIQATAAPSERPLTARIQFAGVSPLVHSYARVVAMGIAETRSAFLATAKPGHEMARLWRDTSLRRSLNNHSSAAAAAAPA